MSRILVTGLGTVGVVCVEKLAAEGHDVIVYDVASPALRAAPIVSRAGSNVKLVYGDITDQTRLLEIVKQHEVEGIIHTVALTHRSASQRLYPTAQVAVNFGGTLNVLEVARIMDLKRVIFTSSGAVLGKIGSEAKKPIDETYVVNLSYKTSFYDVTKYMSELMMATYHRVYGLDTATCRLSWVFGIAENVTEKDLGYYLREVMKGNKIVEPSGADVTGDYSYNRDVANGIYLMYTCKNLDTPAPNRLYHLSGGKTWRLGDIMEIINKIGPGRVELGPGMSGKWESFKDSIRPVPFDIGRMRMIGYSPRSMEEAIQDYAKWLRQSL